MDTPENVDVADKTARKRLLIAGLVLLIVIPVFLGIVLGSYLILRGTNSNLRQLVYTFVTRVGNPAVSPVSRILHDQTAPTSARIAAARALSQIGSEKAFINLIDALSMDDMQVKNAVINSLAQGGESAIPYLVGALTDPEREISAIETLVQMSKTISVHFNLAGIDLSDVDLTGVIFSGADLSGANLSNTDLSGADLSGADLSNANLEGANLHHAYLGLSNLQGANLVDVDLSDADLSGSTISVSQLRSVANLQGIVIRDCNLDLTDLSELDFSGADMSNCDLEGADLSNTTLEEVDLTGANLKSSVVSKEQIVGVYSLRSVNLSDLNLGAVDFSDFDLSGVDLSNTNLRGARLDRAMLNGSILSNAVLIGSTITPEQLHQADSLMGADLYGLNFSDSNLSGLDFSRVNLSNTNLNNTNLHGTILQGAILRRSSLAGSNITVEQLAQASDISGVILSGLDFDQADLSGLDLSLAKLDGANLSGSDLAGVNLDGVNLASADLSGSNISAEQLRQAGNLNGVFLRGQDLRGVELAGVDLSQSDLSGGLLSDVNLSSGFLEGVNLTTADLSGANLDNAVLDRANLTEVNLAGATLNGTSMIDTVGLTLEMLRSAQSYERTVVQTEDQLLGVLRTVCNGGSDSAATPYDPGEQDSHPLAVLRELNDVIFFPEWAPRWATFLELVACVQPEENVIQVCTNYYLESNPSERAPDIERIRHEITIKIVQVKDGRIVEEKIFRGSNPRACRTRENIYETRLYGEPVDENLINELISSYHSP